MIAYETLPSAFPLLYSEYPKVRVDWLSSQGFNHFYQTCLPFLGIDSTLVMWVISNKILGCKWSGEKYD